MQRSALRAECRRRLDDLEQPPFWSDDQIDELLDDAQEQAAICGNLLDVELALSARADKATYDVPAHVYFIDEVRISSDSMPLEIITRAQLDHDEPRWRDWGTGDPQYAILDPGGKALRLAPVPSAAATLTLTGFAVPSESQRMTSESDEPVIPAIHHKALVHWVCAEAFETRDADKGNMELSQLHRQRFHARFGPPVDAGQLRFRQRERRRRVAAHWM